MEYIVCIRLRVRRAWSELMDESVTYVIDIKTLHNMS